MLSYHVFRKLGNRLFQLGDNRRQIFFQLLCHIDILSTGRVLFEPQNHPPGFEAHCRMIPAEPGYIPVSRSSWHVVLRQHYRHLETTFKQKNQTGNNSDG